MSATTPKLEKKQTPAIPKGHSSRINNIIEVIKATKYLEIGVEAGNTFLNVLAKNKVAVDPKFRIDDAIQTEMKKSGSQFFEVTSDDFFNQWDKTIKFDVILIDGLHTYSQTLRDFTNSLSVSHEKTVWVIDDVLPTNYASVARTQMEFHRIKNVDHTIPSGWYGDTYKILFFIQSYFPSLSMLFYGGSRGQAVVFRDSKNVLCQDKSMRPFDIEDISNLDFAAFQLHRSEYFPEQTESEVYADLREVFESY